MTEHCIDVHRRNDFSRTFPRRIAQGHVLQQGWNDALVPAILAAKAPEHLVGSFFSRSNSTGSETLHLLKLGWHEKRQRVEIQKRFFPGQAVPPGVCRLIEINRAGKE